MSESLQTGRAALLLDRLHALTDELLTLDLGRDADFEFTDAYSPTCAPGPAVTSPPRPPRPPKDPSPSWTRFPHPTRPQTEPDPRSATQRRHDVLLALTDMVLLSGGLPRTGGATTSVILTMTTEDYLTGHGLATNGHGNVVPAQQALAWITGDSQLLRTALNSMREITHCSSVHRCHTEQQRLAIVVRDQHCTGRVATPRSLIARCTTSLTSRSVDRPGSTKACWALPGITGS